MQFITDRTQEDVLLKNQKGRYTYRDLNRVEQAVKELSLQAAALDCPVLSTKTDWGLPGDFSKDTWPTESQMERFLGNVQSLCSCVLLAAELPFTMQELTWEGANNIEKALEQVQQRIAAAKTAFQYSGELFAGEE